MRFYSSFIFVCFNYIVSYVLLRKFLSEGSAKDLVYNLTVLLNERSEKKIHTTLKNDNI